MKRQPLSSVDILHNENGILREELMAAFILLHKTSFKNSFKIHISESLAQVL